MFVSLAARVGCVVYAFVWWCWCGVVDVVDDLFGLAGVVLWRVKNGGLKIVKNGPRVWAFCKIEFPGIQKPVQFFGQKSSFFEKCGNRGVGVIWWVVRLVVSVLSFYFFMGCCNALLVWGGVADCFSLFVVFCFVLVLIRCFMALCLCLAVQSSQVSDTEVVEYILN